jgi:NAD kinase
MKIKIFSEKDTQNIESFLGDNFKIVGNSPEVVIIQGGDGMLLKSEIAFPGIPKLLIKGSQICKLCSPVDNEKILEKFKNGSYSVEEFMKLEARVEWSDPLLAINDIIVHNTDPRHAIRYKVYINQKSVINRNEIIGDGIVVATSLGSTGYYRSITDSFFEVGVGLAFNNSTEQSDHMVLKEEAIIELEVTRGPALVYADNNPSSITLENGMKVVISKSDKKAKIVRVV